MKAVSIAFLSIVTTAPMLVAQGLREVPQRFAYVQPIGLMVGLGYAGLEWGIDRRTSIEFGGTGVYSNEDGVRLFGGGPGVGIRRYFGEGELAGVVFGLRADLVWLTADNRRADRQFLSIIADNRRTELFPGIGGLVGYRVVTPTGFVIEPNVSYEYFIGPRPLVSGSRQVQNQLGFSFGVALGWAW